MPFSRRNLAPVIQSRKHEVFWTNLSENNSTVTTIVLAKGTQAADITDATPTEVQTGATIRAIFLEFHFAAETITSAKTVHWAIGKQPFGTSIGNPNLPMLAQRRFIFKRGMEMLPKDVATVFKRIVVVRIPPRFRRLGINDELVFKYITSSVETINACGIAVYKAFND